MQSIEACQAVVLPQRYGKTAEQKPSQAFQDAIMAASSFIAPRAPMREAGSDEFRLQSRPPHEPFTWALQPEAMQDFLAAHRFRLVEMALTRQFSDPSAIRTSMLEGENLVVCEPIY